MKTDFHSKMSVYRHELGRDWTPPPPPATGNSNTAETVKTVNGFKFQISFSRRPFYFAVCSRQIMMNSQQIHPSIPSDPQ